MMTEVYAIYGASGCGRGIMPLAREQLGSADNLYFIDDGPSAPQINNQQILSYQAFLALKAERCYIAIAIANSRVRERLAHKILADGCLPWSVSAKSAIIMDEVEIGEGALLSPFTTITSNIHIGKYFHGNIGSYVEHDCVIGDFVTFAPRVACNGNIVIEDHVYIGAGAVIKQGTPDKPLVIGKGAVVGMGAVVTKSIPAEVTVVGNPAKIMDR
ncbi:MAG: acetyltransferase [Gammaproteobacteria bacterium]|nr:MAG: acetyltransferase [Gammaproteobacteria bacterium]